jgi:cation transport protein ChaC
MNEFWVFGYGSLMWRPGFTPVESQPATLHGYHRGLCVFSVFHRGTQRHPGLVLGLDRGGACRGQALRVGGDEAGTVLKYLRERELITNVYVERRLGIRLDDGRRVEAIAYVVDRSHALYAGRLPAAEAARRVARSRGNSGDNRDYVAATLLHLREAGVRDPSLEAIGALIGVPPAAGRVRRVSPRA